MKYCPRCYRTEAETATCPTPDFPGMSCPDLKDEDPGKDITLSCGPCEFTRVVPIREVLSGKAKTILPSCRRDECACVVVPSEAPPCPGLGAMPELAEMAERAAEQAPMEEAPSEDAPAEDAPAKKTTKAKK